MSFSTKFNAKFQMIKVDLLNSATEFSHSLIKVIDRVRNELIFIKVEKPSNLMKILKNNTKVKDTSQCDVSYVSTVGMDKKTYREIIKEAMNAFSEKIKVKETVEKPVAKEPVKTVQEPTEKITVYAYIMPGNHAAIITRPTKEEHNEVSLLKHIHSSDVRFKCGFSLKLRTVGTVDSKKEINELCKKHLSKFKVIYNARYMK